MGKFYKEEEVVSSYDKKRFKGQGGRVIKEREEENVLQMLGDLEDKKVLDLGAGTCRYSVKYALKGAEVTAVDISEKMLDIGRKKATEAGVEDEIDFKVGDAKNTDFKDESFDIVTSLRLFHLIDDPKTLFHEMKRLTKDKVLFDFFNLWSARVFYNKFLRMNSKLRRKRKLKKLLTRNGFYNIQVERDFLCPYGLYRFSPKPLPLFYKRLDSSLGSAFPFKKLCSVVYIGGRKS